jgi:FAD-linked oxidoreductase
VTKPPISWRNWSGTVSTSPRAIVYPTSIEDVVALVEHCRREGRTLRVVGSGHSFTPIAASNDILVSLDRMQGIISVDPDASTATVWAGTKLKVLGELLHKHGLAQENLGDVDVQSIAGAISTGTHGTGRDFGNLATQVVSLTLVTGTGEVVDYSPASHPELFAALPISLGVLGIVVQVKLRLRPRFRMVYESRRVALRDCLQTAPALADAHRHFEFYWFPYAEPCQLKCMDETEDDETNHKLRDFFSKIVLENGAFGLLSKLSKAAPALSPAVSRLCATTVPVFREVGYSHRLFATDRRVRFNEMEYNLPASAMVPVIEEMRAAMRKARFHVHFPIECRYAKADDLWLSPAYGRDSAYIAVHMYRGMPYQSYFVAMEEIFLRHGGRPHWGKLHTLCASDLAVRYPKWSSFLELRSRLDPDSIFPNEYLRNLFGLGDATQSEQQVLSWGRAE